MHRRPLKNPSILRLSNPSASKWEAIEKASKNRQCRTGYDTGPFFAFTEKFVRNQLDINNLVIKILDNQKFILYTLGIKKFDNQINERT